MAKPQVEIEVDEATGRWDVDGLPMILIPQHFFLNNHRAMEGKQSILLRPPTVETRQFMIGLLDSE